MAFAATLHANILFVNMAPALAAHYLVTGRNVLSAGLRAILSAVGMTLAGFGALTLTLCLVNWSVGRDFLFFQPILDIVFNYVTDTDHMKAWWTAWSSGWLFRQVGYWPAGAYYLAIPAATMVVGAWVLLRQPSSAWRDSASQPGLFLIAQFILLAVVWIVWQSLGSVALEPDYFAYPLIIPCILALAGIMAVGGSVPDEAVMKRRTKCLALAALLLAAVPGADILGHLLDASLLAQMSQLRWVILFFAISLLLIGTMTQAWRQPFLVVAMMALFQLYFPPFMEAALAYTGAGPFGSIRARYSAIDHCSLNRTAFDGVLALDRLASEVGRLDHFWLWLGPQEIADDGHGCVFSLSSFRGSASSLSTNGIGSPADMAARQIPENQISGLALATGWR